MPRRCRAYSDAFTAFWPLVRALSSLMVYVVPPTPSLLISAMFRSFLGK